MQVQNIKVQGLFFICVSGRMIWIRLTTRSCLPASGSAGMLAGITWTIALGPVLLRTYACSCAHTSLICQACRLPC